MKKIALCISGHMRNYIDLLPKFNEFFNYLSTIGSVDIFIATWDQRNTTSSWSAAHGDVDIQKSKELINAHDIAANFNTYVSNIAIYNYSFFNSIYSPLRYNLLTDKQYNWDPRGIHNDIVHSCKMLFLIYQANILKCQQEFVNNQRYDMVIRTRPDMLYNINMCNNIPFNNMLDQHLYITFRPGYVGLYDDRFAFGSSKVMDMYSSAFHRIPTTYDQNLFGDPETMLYISIKNLLTNINVVNIARPGLLVSEKTGGLR